MGDKPDINQCRSLLESSGSEEGWRLFIGIPLPSSLLIGALEKYQTLYHQYHSIRWVKPENWHITLLFIGSTPPAAIETISQSLSKAASSCSHFDIELAGLGGFPRLSKARVVWVGVKSGRDPLTDLAGSVRRTCAEAGFPGDKKPFEAHLTLGRTRNEPVSITVEPEVYSHSWGFHSVTEIHLIRSFLEKGGPRYETISVGRLK